MKAVQVFLGFILWVLPLTLSGQRNISGKIIDAENGNPVPGASVFIANSTVGTITDAEGYYSLNIPGAGNYQLTVSHVGYQAVFKEIASGNTEMVLNVALFAHELDEVTVAKKVRFRQTDINLFWRTILGKNPSRNTIQVLNPEAVYYFYNPETRILTVTCREPLQIVNYETGYRIQSVLNAFKHNYNTDMTDWIQRDSYTELEPSTVRQQNSWGKKRQEVYKLSLTKFIKSLYHNSMYEDGFVLAAFHQNPASTNSYQLSVLNPDSLLTENSADNSKTLNLKNERVVLICYGRPVTDDDLALLKNAAKNEFIQRSGLLMNILNGDSIRIYSDGTYANRIQVAPVNKSSSLLGLSMSLPIEYFPEKTSLSVKATSIADQAIDMDSISSLIDNQLNIYPQEKIHLHTDRDFYVPGEKIWFKAYVIDAYTHLFPTHSRYVYVELISPNDTVVSRVMIRPAEDEMFYGHLSLTELIPEGNYTLRAYTRYMENMGDDYFFKKNIRIGGLKNNYELKITNYEKGTSSGNRRSDLAETSLVLAQDDYDVSFFPEGGNLVEGVFCRVAFKALNRNGYPEIISGKVFDENGEEITSVQTFYAGMGVFTYIPDMRKRYFLKCRNRNGLERQFELPQPNPQAYALTASRKNGRLLVGVQHSISAPEIPCYLLVHCRGNMLYFEAWNNKKETVVFAEERFPAGVIQLVLFDGQMNPLSERLVFSKNYDTTKVAFQTDKEVYVKREKVAVTIKPPLTPPEDGKTPSLSGRAGEGLSGVRLSVAITDDADIAVDSSTTILSSLLLSSELKGYIENPAYYLQDNIESSIALDYLMMTHGWRRYNIPEVVKGNPAYPKIPYQTDQEISGRVKSLISSRPVAGSEISIMTKAGFLGSMTADENGRFRFQGFEYPDSTAYFVQALNSKGSDRVELVLDEEPFPQPVHARFTPALSDLTPALSKGEGVETDNYPSQNTNTFIAKAEQRAKYDEDMRTIYLSEIEVTAPRIERKDEPRLRFPLNKGSDFTIPREEFERVHRLSISDYLLSVPGVMMKGGYIYIRGQSKFSVAQMPLLLIDGIVSESGIDDLPVEMVESIDVFTGTSTTLFGARGTNGVISITTRRGLGFMDHTQKNEFNYTVYNPLGYQKPVEFYSPKYETLESKQSAIPDYRTTIFWKPDVVISDAGEASFEFYTSDFPTTYSVLIEGITTNGSIIRQVEKIRVE